MPDHKSGPIYFVTASNHAWIAKETGWTRDEIRVAYQEAHDQGVVCTLSRKQPGAQRVNQYPSPAVLVHEFMLTYGQAIRDKPTVSLSNEEVRLRIELIREEWEGSGELKESMEAGDIVGIADGLADLVYVLYGAANAYGLDLDEILAEVHRSNMSKLGPDGEVLRREDGKIMKGPGYFEPDLELIIYDRTMGF